jgi:hypothetical protein
MKTSGPVFCLFPNIAALLLLSTAAFAQAPPKYDPGTETTVKGVIQELKLVPPSGGKPIVYMAMKGNPDPFEVFLCPKKFLDDIGVAFKADDQIEIIGSKVKQGSADLILAREVTKSGDTFTLRFKDGKPAW